MHRNSRTRRAPGSESEVFESILIAETACQIGRGNLLAVVDRPAIQPCGRCPVSQSPNRPWAGLSERPIIGDMNFRSVEVLIGGFRIWGEETCLRQRQV
jgi:hypothetical protein